MRSRKRRLNPRARRALELLASNALGLTEALMLAHGFTGTMLAALVRAGLVTTQFDAIIGADWKMIEIIASRSRLRAERRSTSDTVRLKLLTLRPNTAGMSRKPQQPP